MFSPLPSRKAQKPRAESPFTAPILCPGICASVLSSPPDLELRGCCIAVNEQGSFGAESHFGFWLLVCDEVQDQGIDATVQLA